LIFASKNLFLKIDGRTRILWQTHDSNDAKRHQRNKMTKKSKRDVIISQLRPRRYCNFSFFFSFMKTSRILGRKSL